ncbi:MAG: hypothetical protein DWQ47_01170 [Acidobacteria bacterium]|nr:MAG: hypothetical protein DWQ32_11630 [Acidobacteriota bacterium]REK04112.1 MAG: hypothetical protein DWQ38_01155 [Acidobacteriota bacterium]REK15274.1 MAG: hypothetical protein DWQ43_17320 [Acidobacteriota bacterium]REK46364.1 MAG: hypothetical protein DWQ47_01170 [Acidobacteriota bacterium]
MNIETLTTFLGWCTLINFSLLIVATISLVVFKELVTNVHAKLFGISDENLHREYFQYLANFKILVLVFNFVPWVVLRYLM